MSDRPLRSTEILFSFLLFAFVVAALFPEVSVGGRTISAAPHIPFTLPTGPVGMTLTKRHPLMDAYDGWIREANYPYLERALAAGRLPFWIPHQACGSPFLAGLLPGFFFPPNALLLVGNQPLGFDLTYLVRLVLAGWLMFLFLRVHGLRPLGAFVGGVLFLGCGYLVGGLNLPNACVEVMIPGMLLGTECLLTHGRRRDLALAVVMVALVLVGGNPQPAFLVFATACAYAAARILTRGRRDRIQSAARFVTALVLGAMLAAPQLFLFLEFFAHSAHTHGAEQNVLTMPWPMSILCIVPEFYRNACRLPEMAASGGAYGEVELAVWLHDAASGRLSARATFSGNETETVRLRPSRVPARGFTDLGIEVPEGGCLEIESVTWNGRRIPAADLRRSSHNWKAFAEDRPLRATATTIVALPPAPPGSRPELVLHGRSTGQSVRVGLIEIESKRLRVFSCRRLNGRENGRRFRVDLSSFAGRGVQLGLVVSGNGRVASLGLEPDVFAERGQFGSVRLFEHRRALPRAFGVYRAETLSGDDEQLDKVLDPRFPIDTTAVLASWPDGLKLPNPPPSGSPRVVWEKEDPAGSRIELATEFAADGLLVLHDSYYPGWHAYVDDAPAELVRANYCFRAVPVPAGRHRVASCYEPLSWRLGLLVEGLALVVLLVLFLRWRLSPAADSAAP